MKPLDKGELRPIKHFGFFELLQVLLHTTSLHVTGQIPLSTTTRRNVSEHLNS